ncbi:hypothetical protein HYS28_00845 [Candidatus Uhrbacteria bacterium]|nr:hypothetical protein [Candidatus Uhrbacteria bacterium]
MGYAIAFVGPSKSGKTTIMDELLARMPGDVTIIRSVTTRPQRDDEDAVYYEFISREEFERRIAADAFAHHVEHATNYYGTQRADIHAAMASHRFCVGAFVEQGVLNLRRNGFTPIVIKIIPEHYEPNPDPVRRKEDEARDRINLGPDLVVVNSFLPGGKASAVEQVRVFLSTLQ